MHIGSTLTNTEKGCKFQLDYPLSVVSCATHPDDDCVLDPFAREKYDTRLRAMLCQLLDRNPGVVVIYWNEHTSFLKGRSNGG